MTVPTNQGAIGSAGLFATTRRGGLTADEIRQAKDMRAKRWGVQNIANVLGRCREDVQRALEPVALEAIPGPTSPRSADERLKAAEGYRDKRFAEMWAGSASIAEIADHFSVSTNTIHSWRIRLRLPTRQAPGLEPKQSGSSKTCGPEAERVADAIAGIYGLRLNDLAPAPSKANRYAHPRQHIMAALMDCGYSAKSIGDLLRTDNGTVSYGAKAHRLRQRRAEEAAA